MFKKFILSIIRVVIWARLASLRRTIKENVAQVHVFIYMTIPASTFVRRPAYRCLRFIKKFRTTVSVS